MRRFAQRAAAAIAAVATTVSLTAVPASAAPASWTVTPGGVVTWANTRGIRALNMDTGVSAFHCPLSVASANMPGGTGLPGTGIAALTDVTFSGCAGTATSPTVTPGNLPWSFNAVSYNGGTGVTSGTVTGFTVTVSTGYCTFTIGAPGGEPGTISATYTNSNPNTAVDLIELSSTDLEVQTTSGSGCASLYVPGHDITLLGQYGVVPPGQSITSP